MLMFRVNFGVKFSVNGNFAAIGTQGDRLAATLRRLAAGGEYEVTASGRNTVQGRNAQWRAIAGSVCLAVCGWSSAASAQAAFDPTAGKGDIFKRNKYVSVTQRPQPEFDPKPLQIAGAELLADAHSELAYNSNVLATDTNRRDDASVVFGGEANLLATPGGNQLSAFAQADVTRFFDVKSENAERYAVGGAGIFGTGRESTVQIGADYLYQPLSRQSELSPISTQRQINFAQYHAFAGATYGPGRVHVSGTLDYVGRRFSDVPSQDPVAPQLDFGDRDFFSFTGRADYAVTGSVALFAQGKGTLYDYSSNRIAAPSRDSDGIEMLTGLNFELSAPIRGEVSVGYISRHYDDAAYRDFSDIGFHARVDYFPTALVTVGVTADREFGDTSIIGVGGVRLDRIRLKADYEALRNLTLTAEGGVSFQDYRGIDLKYTFFTAGFSGEYAVSPALAGKFYYRFQDRDAEGTVIGREFNASQFGAGMSYRF